MIEKTCIICKNNFETKIYNKKICSNKCRIELNKIYDKQKYIKFKDEIKQRVIKYQSENPVKRKQWKENWRIRNPTYYKVYSLLNPEKMQQLNNKSSNKYVNSFNGRIKRKKYRKEYYIKNKKYLSLFYFLRGKNGICVPMEVIRGNYEQIEDLYEKSKLK